MTNPYNLPDDVYTTARNLMLSLSGEDLDATKLIAMGILVERERAAEVAENWAPEARLLPLCGENENKAAAVGQHEAAERIADRIRAPVNNPP